MKDVYLFDISRTTDATTLHTFRMESETDLEITQTDKDEISAAIDARFGALNLAARGEQKPRWK